MLFDRESRGVVLGLALLGVIVLVLAVANWDGQGTRGGWYGADGIWHRAGGNPR